MTRASLLAATVISLFAASAYADVIPQEVYACNNLSTGSPCDNGPAGAGVCQDSTCSRLDYAHWDRDAAAFPPSTSYSCRKCVPQAPGTATTTSATTDTNPGTTTATGATTGTGEGTGTGAITATPTATSTATASGTDSGAGDQEKDKDSSGCSMSGARVIAPWLLAGIFAACVSLLRRRRR